MFNCGNELCRVATQNFRIAQVRPTHIVVVRSAQTVHHKIHRVYTLLNLAHVFRLGHVAERLSVHHAKVGVEVNDELLIVKTFAVVRHIGSLLQAQTTLSLQTFKLLTLPKFQEEVHLICRHFQLTRVSQHNLRTVKTAVGLVDNHVVEHPRFSRLTLHEEVYFRHPIVKLPLGNLKRGRRLLHAKQQLAHANLRLGGRFILKVERSSRQEQHHNEYGLHNAYERHTRRLHRQQLQLLRHVTKRNQRSQQYRQRQRLRHQRDAHIPVKASQYIQRQPLADKFVHIAPSKLHHKHEKCDAKGCGKHQQELLQDEQV